VDCLRTAMGLVLSLFVLAGHTFAAEPVNPFPPRTAARDSVPGVVHTSDGKVFAGEVFLTPGKQLPLFDPVRKENILIALRDLDWLEVSVVAERVEREWRFKEEGSDEKVFTGKTYPRRDYALTLQRRGGKPQRVELANGVPLYVLPHISREAAGKEGAVAQAPPKPVRFFLQPYDRGEPGMELKDIVYVRRVEFGAEAVAKALSAAAEQMPPGERENADKKADTPQETGQPPRKERS